MPELPEVEVTRRSFASRIEGAQILDVRMGKPLRWPLGERPELLAGRCVSHVTRRGKYLVLHLTQHASPAGVIMVHLGMSGSLLFAPEQGAMGVHDHFSMRTTQGELRLYDPRRFGAVIYGESLESPLLAKLLGTLGVEPLEDAFEAHAFHAALKKRHAAIKQVLLAGDIVVGVGNIYASEALFMSGIRPTLKASKLSAPRAVRLHAAIRQVLQAAVDKGGSTLRDFASADGQTGYFQLEAKVYDRAGQGCRVCGTTIKRIVQGQRSTYYCPNCQTY
jgi:formamidopyrimidine-DNA glycosylase